MPKTLSSKATKPYEETVKALFSLSHVQQGTKVDEVLDLIAQAPDIETAKRAIAARIQSESDVLAEKWRDLITSAWSQCHPRAPLMPELPLSAEDVKNVPIIHDVHEVVKELGRQSAAVYKEHNDYFLEPAEALRLSLTMPSWQGIPEMTIEHEWAIFPLHRLRVLLQTLGLVRIVQGHLIPVRSKVAIFERFPLAQQFYTLWHAEVYHVNWGTFAGNWHRYFELIQGYLPLLWDIHGDIQADMEDDSNDWTAGMLEAFAPLWEQEGLKIRHESNNIMHLYRQLTVPAMMKKLIFQDIFSRYRLVQPIYDPLNALIAGNTPAETNQYVWTSIGEALITAERLNDLPCGIELLKRNNH